VSISATFYEKLLCTQIPKAPQKSDKPLIFFALLGSAWVKAVVGEIDPRTCRILI
jgi:hypothetical protein